MRRVRIAFYSDADSVGGAEIVLAHLVERLDPDRYEPFAVLVSERVAELLSASRSDLSVTLVPPVATKWDVRPLVAHLRALRAIRPRICHANLRTPFACQYGAVAAIATPGTRLVVVEHLPLPTKSRFRRALKRYTSRHAAAHIAVGERTAREIELVAGLPAGSVRAVYNGVPDRAVPVKPRVSEGPVVGYVGRLDAQKNLRMLIDAVARLPDVVLVLGGDGPTRDILERRAAAAGVGDRVIVTGWDSNARDLIRSFDVFALPSDYEGFPLVLLEAMLAGVATVATRVGSIPDLVVDGVNGRLVDPGDLEGLARALRELLSDEEQRRRLATEARAIVLRDFSVDAMIEGYEAIYAEVS